MVRSTTRAMRSLGARGRYLLLFTLMLIPLWGRAGVLDQMDPAALHRALLAELDDESLARCGLRNPRGPIETERMYQIIICALGDYGDHDDEQELSLADIVEEMEEAHDNLEHVVRLALGMAEQMAAAPPAARGALVRVRLSLERPEADDTDMGRLGPLARPDGYINPAILARGTVVQSVEVKTRSVKPQR